MIKGYRPKGRRQDLRALALDNVFPNKEEISYRPGISPTCNVDLYEAKGADICIYRNFVSISGRSKVLINKALKNLEHLLQVRLLRSRPEVGIIKW